MRTLHQRHSHPVLPSQDPSYMMTDFIQATSHMSCMYHEIKRQFAYSAESEMDDDLLIGSAESACPAGLKTLRAPQSGSHCWQIRCWTQESSSRGLSSCLTGTVLAVQIRIAEFYRCRDHCMVAMLYTVCPMPFRACFCFVRIDQETASIGVAARG